MSDLYFIADTHFGHRNILDHCSRPFASVEEHDEYLIARINERVRPEDTLFHLGDFCWGDPVPYRRRIACQHIHLIVGNHDSHNLSAMRRAGIFVQLLDYWRLNVDGQKLVLCHYPMESWSRRRYHLHGHSHGNSRPRPWRLDVGVDCTDYTPISLAEVIARLGTHPDTSDLRQPVEVPDITVLIHHLCPDRFLPGLLTALPEQVRGSRLPLSAGRHPALGLFALAGTNGDRRLVWSEKHPTP